MWPRQLLGYHRSENPQAVQPICELYRDAWGPLHNFFLPSTQLVEKRRQSSRIVRKHDLPQTAYQRLLASGQLDSKKRRRLRDQFASLDPFALAQTVEKRLQEIFS
jgi:hypothetical protein